MYSKKYKDLCATDFVILDNGAAEDKMLSYKELIEVALEYQPTELVLPDIIGNALGTIECVREFLGIRTTHNLPLGMGYNVVAQGKSVIEVQRMIQVVAEFPNITTICLPRHLVATLGTRDARLLMARWIHKKYQDKFAIHFLGCAPSYPEEAFYAHMLGFVRGIDTSMPFNYALANTRLRSGIKNIKRSDDYFNAKFNFVQEELARKNVHVMNEWATGRVYDDRAAQG